MSANESFGLSDNELKVALCALKAMIADGKVVDKNHLARLTGHSNADSANRIWYMAKNKLTKADSPADPAASLEDVDTPTKGPKKAATKMRTQAVKKRGKKQAADEEDNEDGEEKPSPKRVKKAAAKDAGVEDEL